MSTIAATQPSRNPTTGTAGLVPLAALPLRRITVDEYDRIGASGALDEPERVELIDGYMVKKMPKSAEHGYSTKETLKALDARLPAGWTSRKEEPVRIPAFDEPEPDISIVRGTDQDYRHRHPGPTDVGLLVEVSLSTLDLDRGQKLLAFATAGIAVYWIINLVERQVEVYTNPAPGVYRSRTDYKAGQKVPLALDGQHLGDINVDDLLP